VTEEEGV